MVKLKISEVILKKRREKNLTQEELAKQLDVSAQAISNWERGGYPDIVLLPLIADVFGITVDELLGHDEVTREADIEDFKKRYGNYHASPESLSLAKEYYKKYPDNFEVMELLADAIHRNKEAKEKNYPLLREVSEKVMKNCTWGYLRQNIVEIMSIDCTDEEWKDGWMQMCPQFYSRQVDEILEQRHWERKLSAKFHSQSEANTLMNLLHFFGREYMLYHEKDTELIFDAPDLTINLMRCRMKIIESLGEETVPEAFCGMYADMSLKLSGALIGAGMHDEGFDELERTFEYYDRWLNIPDNTMLKTENPAFGGAVINKCGDSAPYDVNITMSDGTVTWCPYLWLFWQQGKDIERALNGAGMISKAGTAETGWPWFDCVRNDPRFITALKKASVLPRGTQYNRL